MRPPNKSRSRNKNNRRGGGQNLGNALNRVYESAGPEGKVRGTPVQVIEKYQALAHDSSLAGDRVATENFQQHAEHYIRLINDVQRQLAEQREAQQAQQQQNNQNNNGNGRGQQNNNNGKGQEQPNGAPQPDVQAEAQPPVDAPVKSGKDEALSVLGDSSEGDQPSGLVETPESSAAPEPEAKDPPKRRRSRSRSNPAPEAGDSAGSPDTPAE